VPCQLGRSSLSSRNLLKLISEMFHIELEDGTRDSRWEGARCRVVTLEKFYRKSSTLSLRMARGMPGGRSCRFCRKILKLISDMFHIELEDVTWVFEWEGPRCPVVSF